MKKEFPAQVWKTLAAVNVNEQTEKKQNLTYLSWAWAWQVLMEYYPQSSYEIHPEKTFDDGSVEVSVSVTVSDGENSLTRYMWLPVIDHRNNAVKHPDAFIINKNKMRCLVKCIAMFGLGLYIYAGEDLPEAEKPAAPHQGIDIEETTRALRQAASLDNLKAIFGHAWTAATKEQQPIIKDIYDHRKADFEAEQEAA